MLDVRLSCLTSPLTSVRIARSVGSTSVAIHGPTADPPDEPKEWVGEAKVSGRAVELPREGAEDAHRFRIDIDEVVFTHLNEAGDRLEIESWHPDRGREVIDRA